MAQNCNRIAELTEAQYDEKAALAKAATSALLDAMSDCYKAAQVVHSGQAVDRAVVYLQAAVNRVDVATTAIAGNQSILDTAPDDREARQWLSTLDYVRLYREGIRDAKIPANEVEWSALVEINRTDGVLGVTAGLMSRFAGLRDAALSLVNVLTTDSESAMSAAPAQLVDLLSVLANVAAFAQMVAYVNRLEPMDPRWSDASISAVGAKV